MTLARRVLRRQPKNRQKMRFRQKNQDIFWTIHFKTKHISEKQITGI